MVLFIYLHGLNINIHRTFFRKDSKLVREGSWSVNRAVCLL